MKHIILILLGISVLPASLFAQKADSSVRLPELQVTVTRTPTPLSRVVGGVTVLDSIQLHRNQLAPTLDDALAWVPGLVISNRWNYSLDQRLAIRGFGARANFGWRGVKVLIDGIPQTLPDGQSQLNHLDLSQVTRLEVLRGAASAEYGNAAGGVLSFTTTGLTAGNSFSAGAETGSFGSRRLLTNLSARQGNWSGSLGASWFSTDGFRQHSGAEQRRLNGALSWIASGNSTLTLRVALASDPQADNPGALTLAELNARRDSAAANNILRNAGKEVTQSQVSLSYHREAGNLILDASAWRLARDLDNPLAAPVPPPTGATLGTWVGIERLAGGGRTSLTWVGRDLNLTAGADFQISRDDRTNERARSGVPTGITLVNQTERVREFGPFIRADWSLTNQLRLSGAARRDEVSFRVIDHLPGPGNGSGSRNMSATSGSMGLGYDPSPTLASWLSLGTSFETPTTTELANQPSGETGINRSLNPQRSRSAELGVRMQRGSFSAELAGWLISTRDAIVPAAEVSGRTYYQNAGQTNTHGLEGSLHWQAAPTLELLGTVTWTRARFGDYYSVSDGISLNHHTLAGLPEWNGRVGVRGSLGRFTFDVDQSLRSGFYADDKNTIMVDGPGMGLTGVRLSWQKQFSMGNLAAYAAIFNLFDRQYVGSVTINGMGGRVFEPSPGRAFTLGVRFSR